MIMCCVDYISNSVQVNDTIFGVCVEHETLEILNLQTVVFDLNPSVLKRVSSKNFDLADNLKRAYSCIS
jgi:hypothetical protein